MKIIFKGKRPEPEPIQSIRMECKTCGTIVEALVTECLPRFDEVERLHWVVPCPVCPKVLSAEVEK